MLVACVLRSGGIYDPQWVDRLYYAVKANWGSERTLEFVCLSDLKWSAPYHLAPLVNKWPGWWSKIELFNGNGFCQGATLYLDLDNVIALPLSTVIERPMRNDDFGLRVMHDPNTKRLQSAVMRWTPQWLRHWGSRVYTTFKQQPERYMADYKWIGDQGFIADVLESEGKRWGYFNELEVTSFKAHWSHGRTPTSTIVQFHGQPKPCDLPPEHPLRFAWDRHYVAAGAARA